MIENIKQQKLAKAKKMMLLFGLLSITMTFAGLTSAYIVSKGRPDWTCLLYTSPSPRDGLLSRMPSSA